MKALIPILLLLPLFSYAQLSTGLGYIGLEDYRVNNEVNPLPLGISVIPAISYRSGNLNIRGPNITYNFLQGPIGFSYHLEIVGERYESQEVKLRNSAGNTGFSLRLLYLTLKHTSDFTGVYRGNITNAFLAHRFQLFDRLMFIPRIGYRYTNKSYNNYYFGVRANEVGTYSFYELENARSENAGATLIFIGSDYSLSLSYSHTNQDQVIYDSPTVALNSYKVWSLFYNFNFK